MHKDLNVKCIADDSPIVQGHPCQQRKDTHQKALEVKRQIEALEKAR